MLIVFEEYKTVVKMILGFNSTIQFTIQPGMYSKGGRFTTFFELQTLFKWQYIDLLFMKHEKKIQADCFIGLVRISKSNWSPSHIKVIFLHFYIQKSSYTLKEAHLNTD